MFQIEISKENGCIEVELNDNYSIAQLDIAFKDICIQLKVLSNKQENFEEKDNGVLKISVSRRREELSPEEDAYIGMRLLPFNLVEINSNGFGFVEIQHIMQNIKEQLPDDFTSRFQYDVDFINLEVH